MMITSFFTSALVVKRSRTTEQRAIKRNRFSRSEVRDTQTTCTRCLKYLCILNAWVEDEGTEVSGVRAGCWVLAEWLDIMRKAEGEEPCKILLCLGKLPHTTLGPSGQGTNERSFLSPREGVAGEELQQTKAMRISPCLYSLFHDILA